MSSGREALWGTVTSPGTPADRLATGALLIAADEYPDLDIDVHLAMLETMGATLRRRLRPDISPAEALIALNRYLFDELGLRGNATEYYDPRNSHLNHVLARRLGIPITLAVIYIDIGRRIGLPLEGVSFPGHFLVRCRLRGGLVFLDPYARGVSLSEEKLRRRVAATQGGKSPDDERLRALLRAATVPEILARMLRNLKAIHLHAGDRHKALICADRILTLLPDSVADLRERAQLYLELECFRAALTDFARYTELAPEAALADGIPAVLAELRRRAASLN